MIATRLQRSTALSLAVLYGLAGVTGESLHYLVTDPAALWSGSGGAVEGYFHTHAPDHHLHFHRHAGHSHDGRGAVAARRTGRGADHGPAFDSERSTHEPHACPLLGLVSTLKLGHAVFCAPLIALDGYFATLSARELRFEPGVVHVPLARGPPCIALA